ncbi:MULTISPECIES: hypothetical protein [unclassified Bradyrhizobium]|uniref:hypothetical protein n=1 Tax=unclassified Bradyrhizobium TaxID=2631580 RepID=UPI00291605F6|nr:MULTISPECIES: hypothetical protein [unclassified Bradyrhizobium]
MIEASAETIMPFSEIEEVSLSYILGKADEIAAQFERHFSSHLFTTMDEATKRTGLRFDGAGRPVSIDAIIDALSMMNIEFDEHGNPSISIVTSPEMAKSFARLEHEFHRNSELRKRWDDMIEKKRDEFRTREINRNLAG